MFAKTILYSHIISIRHEVEFVFNVFVVNAFIKNVVPSLHLSNHPQKAGDSIYYSPGTAIWQSTAMDVCADICCPYNMYMCATCLHKCAMTCQLNILEHPLAFMPAENLEQLAAIFEASGRVHRTHLFRLEGSTV